MNSHQTEPKQPAQKRIGELVGAEPLQKALRYIESNLLGEFSLRDVAQMAGVSAHYLTRAFGLATGYSLMRYARSRRLAEAAIKLAQGAPNNEWA